MTEPTSEHKEQQMAVTESENPGPVQGKGGRRRRGEHATTLDSDVTKPQYTAPGDAPFDTTDETERATSVLPDFAAAARAGHGTVNAVVPLVEPEVIEEERGEDRIETYKQVGPDGKIVNVRHNIDTGETSVS